MSKIWKIPGQWYIPNGKKYEGELLDDHIKGEISLEIYSDEYLEGTSARDGVFPGTPIHYHEIILGGKELTLCGCSFRTSKLVGHFLSKTTYSVQFLIKGTCFHSMSEMLVYGGTFQFSRLATWFDGWEADHKIKGIEGRYVDGVHTPQNVRRTRMVDVKENLKLCFMDDIVEYSNRIGRDNVQLYQKLLQFQYSEPVQLEQLLKDARYFKKLLEFSFLGPLNHKIKCIHVHSDQIKGDSYATPYAGLYPLDVTNYTLHNNEEILDNGFGNDAIVSKWNCSEEEIIVLIQKWFRNEDLHTVYEYFLDSYNWFKKSGAKISNVMYNNRFLNLIHALEDLYRKKFPKEDDQGFVEKRDLVLSKIKNDPELLNWTKERLKRKGMSLRTKLEILLESIQPDLNATLGKNFSGDYIKKIVSFRDNLSHGQVKEVYLGREFDYYFLVSQMVLMVCILKSLEVENIPKKIQGSNGARQRLSDIKRYSAV